TLITMTVIGCFGAHATPAAIIGGQGIMPAWRTTKGGVEVLSRATIFASVLVTTLQVTAVASFAAQWTSERDAGLGYAYSYPSDVFQEIEGDDKPSFHYFEEANSDTKFLVGGWNNR